MVQTILTNIKVVGQKLQLSLAGLGSFTATDYQHIFPLQRVSSEVLEWVIHELSWRSSLQKLPRRIISTFFDTVQVTAPLSVVQSKCYTLQQLQRYLVDHPHLAEQHRFVQRMFDYLIEHPPEHRKPYSLSALRDHLYAHPRVQSRHKPTIDSILNVLAEGWPLDSLPLIPQDKTPRVRLPSPLPAEFYRGSYSKLARWTIAPKGSVVEVDATLIQELQAGKKEVSLQNRITYARQRTLDEILQQPMVVLDIEKPLFNTDEEEISWTALIALQRGQILEKNIVSLYALPSEVQGFQTKVALDEFDLVAQVAHRISRYRQPSIFVTYNVPFDAIQLREAGEFTIGEDEEEPKKISSLRFFERIGIKSMEVLDPLRWARTQFDYLPNKKLVTVAKHVLGEASFQKQITYEQQAELEHLCKSRSIAASPPVQQLVAHRSAPEIIASYVGEDALAVTRLIQSEVFHHGLEDVVQMSQLFTINPFLLLHDAKRIQDYLECKFFQKVGIFRDALFSRFTVFTKYEQRVKDRLFRAVEKSFPSSGEGVFSPITKVYLPLGRVLRQDVSWFFPEAKQFYGSVDQYKDDPQRQFFLARYEDALAEWMWKDYAAYRFERDKLRKMIPKIEERKQFRDYCWNWANRLRIQGLEEKLNRSAVAQKDLLPLMMDTDQKYLAQRGVSFRLFFEEFRQWCKVRQKNRMLWGSWEAGWDTFEERLKNFCDSVNQYLQQHGLKVVHAQNRYLYLQGNTAALSQPESPVIPVDEIETSYAAGGSLYYQKHGAWEGIKREKKPMHHLCVYEMDTFGEFLDDILARKMEEALTGLWRNLDALGCHKVPKEELVWKTGYSGKYRAYEAGEEIHFYEWNSEEESQTKLLKGKKFIITREKDEAGSDFIQEPSYQGKDLVYQKRWLRFVHEIKPDWEIYVARIAEKAKELVKPLLGRDAQQFVLDALAREPEQRLEFYLGKLPRQIELF
ncbi:TPA: hypothetical protein HA242_02940 [Candidatus Woesearchaeota archaeon]|nr:hypothetical protein [Candidatus Woesearchaeota archaeon]HIG93906.1 hypothetical protein [Candidatus Woesearchaeota archaeon]HIH12653.1 hypothetical protein [Candidatus Woesearchaeota archaeon]